ncbi:dihydroneopterin aldolase [Candidatus Gracilibacteria bacterium]|nr:dihydroneopterin aldolase [Candidatus Gracilibacteria bacterium]
MKFQIKDIETEVFLGVEKLERSIKQKILISFSFDLDTSKSEVSDDIADTVDYFPIQEFIKNFPQEKEFNLLEKLHHDLLNELNKNFPDLRNTFLQIEKFPFVKGSVVISN